MVCATITLLVPEKSGGRVLRTRECASDVEALRWFNAMCEERPWEVELVH